MMIFLLVAMLLLTAGCGTKAPVATEAPSEVTIPATEAPTELPTEVPNEASTEPVPECADAQVVLGYYRHGDIAPVVTEEGFAPAWEGYHTLYMNGIYAYIPVELVQEAGAEDYAQWEGFVGYNAYLYDNYLKQGEGKRLNVNTPITVLWEGTDYYVVSVNEEIGYIPVTEANQNRYATGGGAGGGGGDWTPPAL